MRNLTDPPRPLAAGLGNSNDQTRRHNLSTILTLLAQDGAQPRAQLTRRTGLNRSTIAALVSELAERDLVFETAAPGGGTVGRPSPVVNPNGRIACLAVHPDLDAVVVGLVGLGGLVHGRIRRETAGVPTAEQAVALAAGMATELRRRHAGVRVVGAGIALPGLVRSPDGLVTFAPHLGWHDEPLADRMAEALGVPAVATNDAKAAAVAELIHGAGKGARNLVYLNGSRSGIGGAVFTGGRALGGAAGYGGELGHTLADPAGGPCHCGNRGCLETEVGVEPLLAALGRSAADPDELDALLASGAPDVRVELERQLDVLARSIASFIAAFDPELVLLGGFLGSLFDVDPERLRLRVREASFAAISEGVRIERAELRENLVIVGAAELAFAPLLADPVSLSASA
ncbi:ROK family protein [Lysobacter korlensis]|uniref:ROK family protein n=1 Tax=Lysobacter korlensis TaxID=553636 RepID=A0ABV6RY56_9GAMM